MGTFTAISTSAITAPHAAELMDELQLSMEERMDDVGDTSSFTAFAGIEMFAAFDTFFTELQAAAAAMLTPEPFGKYFVNTSLNAYANIDEVLSDAGHGSGWVTIDDTSSIDEIKTAIGQMQDVLLELVHYRHTYGDAGGGVSTEFTISSPGSNGGRSDTDADVEVAWDNATADSFGPAGSLDAGWLQNYLGDWTVDLRGPVIHANKDISGLHGSYEKAVLIFDVINASVGTPLSTVDFKVTTTGDSAIIDTFDETDTGTNTITYTPAGDDPDFSSDVDIDFEITTSEPSDSPWGANISQALIDFGIDGFAIFFDSDGAYTYG